MTDATIEAIQSALAYSRAQTADATDVLPTLDVAFATLEYATQTETKTRIHDAALEIIIPCIRLIEEGDISIDETREHTGLPSISTPPPVIDHQNPTRQTYG